MRGALKVALRGIRTEGPMAPDIPLDRARPAEYVFEKQVQEQVALLHRDKDARKRRSSAA
jgi:hypothetical protein